MGRGQMLMFSGRVVLLAQEPEEGCDGGAQGGRVRDGVRGVPGLSGGGRGAVLRGEEREAETVSWSEGCGAARDGPPLAAGAVGVGDQMGEGRAGVG